MQTTTNYGLKKPEGNEYVSVGDLNHNADKIDEVLESHENPEFDDSGTVEGITSFPAFLATVKSKMKIFDFFKNFVAGAKFLLHTGMLVNNGLTTEAGKYPLDAAYGKTLTDMYSQLNDKLSDYLWTSFHQKDLNDLTTTCHGYANVCTNRPREENGYIDIVSNDPNYVEQTYTTFETNLVYKRVKFEGTWCDWDGPYATTSELVKKEKITMYPTGVYGTTVTNVKSIIFNDTIFSKKDIISAHLVNPTGNVFFCKQHEDKSTISFCVLGVDVITTDSLCSIVLYY